MGRVSVRSDDAGRRWPAAILVAGLMMVGAALYGRIVDVGGFADLRLAYFDALIAMDADASRRSHDLFVVDIDEESIRRIGQWPWPRRHLAALVDASRSAGATAVAFDLVFSEPDRLSPDVLSNYVRGYDPDLAAAVRALPSTDRLFARSLSAGPPTVLGMVGAAGPATIDAGLPPSPFVVRAAAPDVDVRAFARLIRNLPSLEAAAAGVGVSNILQDADGRTRRIPLATRVHRTLYPGLALEAVRVHAGEAALALQPTPEKRAGAVSVGRRTFPTDGDGAVWAPLAHIRLDRASAHGMLQGDVDPALVRGKIVVIGVTAPGAAAFANLADGAPAPSHHVQAAAIATLLEGATIHRPDRMAAMEIAATFLAAALFLGAAAFDRRAIALVALVGAPTAAFLVSRSMFVAERTLFDPTFTAVSLATLGALWAVYLALRQRLALAYERSFVGRIVDHMKEGLIITDDAGAVISANPAAERLMAEGPPLITVDSRLTPAAKLGPQTSDARVVQRRSETQDETRVLEVDSAWISDRGAQVGVHVIRDITTLKEAQDAASIAALRLSSATESMADGLVLFDPAGRIDFHNPALRTVTGLPAGFQLDGCAYETFMRHAFRAPTHRTARDQGAEPTDFQRRMGRLATPEALFATERQTLTGAWLFVRERRTIDGGMVCVYTDITELKNVEAALREARRQAEDASAAKNRFLATVSHELRTPLNAILGFADVIEQEVFGPISNPRYHEYLRHISSSGGELLDLVENLLDVAAADSTEFRIDLQAVDLGALATTVAESFRTQFENGGVRLVLNVDPAMPHCTLDQRATGRILSNLIGNSLKYGASGGEVNVAAAYVGGRGHSLVVRDAGAGMSQEQIDRAFEPFWQGQESELSLTNGMGLGLPLVKTLVERQGGTIEIRSAPAKGTIVRVTFPEGRASEPEPKVGVIPQP